MRARIVAIAAACAIAAGGIVLAGQAASARVRPSRAYAGYLAVLAAHPGVGGDAHLRFCPLGTFAANEAALTAATGDRTSGLTKKQTFIERWEGGTASNPQSGRRIHCEADSRSGAKQVYFNASNERLPQRVPSSFRGPVSVNRGSLYYTLRSMTLQNGTKARGCFAGWEGPNGHFLVDLGYSVGVQPTYAKCRRAGVHVIPKLLTALASQA